MPDINEVNNVAPAPEPTTPQPTSNDTESFNIAVAKAVEAELAKKETNAKMSNSEIATKKLNDRDTEENKITSLEINYNKKQDLKKLSDSLGDFYKELYNTYSENDYASYPMETANSKLSIDIISKFSEDPDTFKFIPESVKEEFGKFKTLSNREKLDKVDEYVKYVKIAKERIDKKKMEENKASGFGKVEKRSIMDIKREEYQNKLKAREVR